MKLWTMPCRATQDGQVIVESSDKMWSTGEGKWQNTSLFLPWEPHKHYEKEKDRTLKDELPRLIGAQYATDSSYAHPSYY